VGTTVVRSLETAMRGGVLQPFAGETRIFIFPGYRIRSVDLLLTNFLGLKHQAFVEDRTNDIQVWNQPLRGYRILSQQTLTAQQANQQIGATSLAYISLEGVQAATMRPENEFCRACFTRTYPTRVPADKTLAKFRFEPSRA